ncbi:MAG: DNA-formamidopyrimidine glycosylase family protein [Rhodothermales bacterium]|nr:DNA-formamidopyrimidine glycosylase family protein [Rhodothermales bacterium]
MPELPDIENYIDALRRHVVGQKLEEIRLKSIFLVRSVDPPLQSLESRTLMDVTRLGKRLVFRFDSEEGDQRFMILHLMIAGRLHWRKLGAGLPGKRGLCAFDFEKGTLLLTEAGKKKRASVYVAVSPQAVAEHDPGGLELSELDLDRFVQVLAANNHTLKRALTDPRLLSGIGGAYADEIMHRARTSPVKWTSRLTQDEHARLFEACKTVLDEWTARIREETGDGWPTVTAFRDAMAVHGKYLQPCPVCRSPVQRIVYAANETNYCATCQTDGKVLADRSLSRLLKSDWPRSLEELEERGIGKR